MFLILYSEEYWRLYENYAALRKKLADAEYLFASTNRKLDDALSECESQFDMEL